MKPLRDGKNLKRLLWGLLAAALVLIVSVIKPNRQSPVTYQPEADTSKINAKVKAETQSYHDRFDTAASSAFALYGVKTRPFTADRDSFGHHMMELVMPGDISDYQARKIALEVFNSLKQEDAMVTVSDDTGKQHAFATKEGVFH